MKFIRKHYVFLYYVRSTNISTPYAFQYLGACMLNNRYKTFMFFFTFGLHEVKQHQYALVFLLLFINQCHRFLITLRSKIISTPLFFQWFLSLQLSAWQYVLIEIHQYTLVFPLFVESGPSLSQHLVSKKTQYAFVFPTVFELSASPALYLKSKQDQFA